MANQIRITTYIDQHQKEWLEANSYVGPKKRKEEGDITFSEHIRLALDKYITAEERK